MCDVTLLEGDLPQALPGRGSFLQRRGLEGTPQSCCLLSPHYASSDPARVLGQRLDSKPWTLLLSGSGSEPSLSLSEPASLRGTPLQGVSSWNKVRAEQCFLPLALWPHFPIHLRLHPSQLAVEGVTKWPSENSLISQEGEGMSLLPHLPPL